MHYTVFDIEILKTVQEVGGWDATDKMGVACCVVYDSKLDSFRVFGDNQREAAIEFITAAPVVFGFNHIEFDWRVLLGLPKSVDVRSHAHVIGTSQYDILEQIKQAAGVSKFEKGFKLDQIIRRNLGRQKPMSGELAPVEWRNGNVAGVIDYCIFDVAATRDLARLILAEGKLQDPRNGQPIRMPRPIPFADQHPFDTASQQQKSY